MAVELFLELAFLVALLSVLAKASEEVIKHAVVLARFFKISELAVGFLLVSVATSLPEFLVSVLSSVRGSEYTALSIGNVLGANISDLLLVLGASALVGKIAIDKKEIKKLLVLLAITAAIPVFIYFDFLKRFALGQFVGAILLLVFAAYTYFILKEEIATEDGGRPVAKEAVVSALLFSAAAAIVLASANFAVETAVRLAATAGISKAFVGATIVSLGTTLPELSVSVVAMRKKLSGLAIGNVLGSCIVNLTLVLGTAAIINPLVANLYAYSNLVAFYFFATIALGVLIRRGKGVLARNEGFALLGLYAVFILTAVLVEARF